MSEGGIILGLNLTYVKQILESGFIMVIVSYREYCFATMKRFGDQDIIEIILSVFSILPKSMSFFWNIILIHRVEERNRYNQKCGGKDSEWDVPHYHIDSSG
jgi:hypothetical protein